MWIEEEATLPRMSPSRILPLNGAIEEDKDRGILIVTYSTRQHTRKKHIPLSDHARADALSWLEATYNRLYDIGKEEELRNDERLNYLLEE